MEDKRKVSKRKWSSIVYIYIIAFSVISLIICTGYHSVKYNLKVGDIAKVSIKSPRDVEDKVTTEKDKEKALQSVPKVYKVDSTIKNNQLQKIQSLIDIFDKVRVNKNSEEILDKIDSTYDLDIDDLNTIISLNDADYTAFRTYLKESVDSLLTIVIRDNNSEDLATVRKSISSKVSGYNLSSEAKNIISKIDNNCVKVNAVVDEDKTKLLEEEALKKVQSVMIKKDQTIVKEGEPIEEWQVKVLESLGLLNSSRGNNFFIYASIVLIVAIVTAMQGRYLYKFRKDIFYSPRKFSLIFFLITIQILFARILVIQPYLIPLGAIVILMVLIFDRETALVINCLTAILLSVVVNFNVQIVIVFLLNIILAFMFMKKLNVRNDIFSSSLIISVVTIIINIVVGNIISSNIIEVLKNSALLMVGGILSAIFAAGALPIIENVFDIVTNIKLLELSNPNNPLLKRLVVEAPGTYHHSLMVGNLAEVAAEEIKANATLARVGAFYHDIGKISNPIFFKENQVGESNPHNNLSSKISAMIIISHVTEGIKLAKEYGLPTVIEDIIREHHGTDLVKYFYITERNNAKNPDDVDVNLFKYPGPIPRRKESAIIMLADGVEAAVRSIKNPTVESITDMVNSIFTNRLSEGQLNDCDLTLKDLDRIKKAFIKVLMSMYHQRIEYPKDKNSKEIEKSDLYRK